MTASRLPDVEEEVQSGRRGRRVIPAVAIAIAIAIAAVVIMIAVVMPIMPAIVVVGLRAGPVKGDRPACETRALTS